MFKTYKTQIMICAVMAVLAVVTAAAFGLMYDDVTRMAIKLYCKIHPAVIIPAVALETLFLVSPMMTNDTDVKTFFKCGFDTAVIVAILDAVFCLMADKRMALVARITMPYIIVMILLFAAGFIYTQLRERKLSGI